MAISYVSNSMSVKVWAADGADDGASWDNPMSFQKIVDHFAASPISAIDMPSSGDIIEDTEWTTGWLAGVYTTATARSNNGDATIELADTTGFTNTGDIWGRDDLYPTRIAYTSKDGTNVFGATWDKWWGNYEAARINNAEIVCQVSKAGVTWDAADFQVGAKSMKYVHGNAGAKVLITRDFRSTDGAYYGLSTVDGYCAETFTFWVKVSNANITLKQAETRVRYSTNGRIFSYGTVWDNDGAGWSFAANTWTQVTITIRDGERRSSRDWWAAISNILFLFEGVANGDTIRLDGAKFHLANPNPREVVPNVLLFPIKIYNKDAGFGAQEFFFYDYGKTVIFAQLHGNFMYLYSGSATYKINLRLGQKGGEETGIVIFGNNWAYDENNYGIYFGNRYYDEYCQLNGFIFMGAHGKCGGINYLRGETTSEKSEIRNSHLYRISDFMESQGNFGVIENLGLHGGRYLPRVTTAGTINNWTIWRSVSGVSWLAAGTYRKMSYDVSFQGQQFVRLTNCIVNLIDCTFGFTDAQIYLSSGGTVNVGYTFNLRVLDADGAGISGVTVVVKDKNSNIVIDTTTAGDGTITAQDLVVKRYTSVGTATKYYATPDEEFFPHTLEVSKDGTNYLTVDGKFTADSPVDWEIAMADVSDIVDGINDLKGTGFVKNTHSLTNVEGHTDLIDDGTNGLAAIKAEVDGLAGAAMRGTDGANQTTPPTVGAIRTEIEGAGTKLTGVKAKTDNLPTDPADQSLIEAAITASEGNVRGADSDTLKTLSGQADTAQLDLNDIHDEAFGRWVLDPDADTLTLYRPDDSVLKVFTLGSRSGTIPNYVGRTPQ